MHSRFQQAFIICIILITACKTTSDGDDKNAVNVAPDEKFTMQGKILAQTSGRHLMVQLSNKIAEKGVSEAVRYCNTAADPLLDSLSLLYHAKITRRSDRYRNPDNAGDSMDQATIISYRNQIEQGLPLSVKTVAHGKNEVRFYAPIFTQALCLNCHGQPNSDIQPNVMAVIDELYPADKAKSFKNDELRGIWSITFQK